MADRTYGIREFAELAGVTVRALHHYDRVGLLKPRRTQTGYRIYSAKDLKTLEQIVALKFIGLSLDKIKLLLRSNRVGLSTALRAQRTLLEQKRGLLDRTISAIGQAETALQIDGNADTEGFRQIIDVIEMQNNRDVWKQKYDELMQGKIERLRPISPDARTMLRKQVADLFKEVEGALGEDPASPRAHELAGRFVELLQTLMLKGDFDPQFLKFAAAYLSDGEWPADAPAPELLGGKRVWEFMARALAVRT